MTAEGLGWLLAGLFAFAILGTMILAVLIRIKRLEMAHGQLADEFDELREEFDLHMLSSEIVPRKRG